MEPVRIGPYEVLRELGRGGMGQVLLARDARLDRLVAIKALPPKLAADPDRLARFQREAKILASLNHPGIGAIFGLEDVAGRQYLVLEFVEGVTLADRLARGPIPVDDALRLAAQIARALEAAHEKGIVHRDLKPANVMVSDRAVVKVLDFGLASAPNDRPPSTVAPPDAPIITEITPQPAPTLPGTVLGTPGYMSPEQARGKPVDKRSDVFSFGCLLYESLTGAQPFAGETVVDTIGALLHREPDWDQLPPTTPPEIGTLLRRCLEKDPARRLSSAADIAITLEESARTPHTSTRLDAAELPASPVGPARRWSRPLTAGLLAVVILAVAAGVLTRPGLLGRATGSAESQTETPTTGQTPTGEAPKSIAVLPFVNLSADESDEYLSDGMTEELLAVLANVKGLRVPGRTSCFAFKGKTDEDLVSRVGEQLHVSSVLEGSVRRAGDKLRITAQLINVADGFLIWSESYDADMADILSVQSDVARRVVQALEVTLGVDESRAIAKRATDNPEAHRLYLLGRFHLAKATDADYREAARLLEQAIELDPSYALAYCGLADVYGMTGGSDIPPREGWAKAQSLASKALQLDPDLAEAHFSLGLALAASFEWEQGEREIKRSIEMNPNMAIAYDQYAWVQTCFGRFDEAIANSRRAVQLEPLSPLMAINQAWWLVLARRYDEAEAQCRRALELDPDSGYAHSILGQCLLYRGDAATAIAELERGTELDPFPWLKFMLGYAYGLHGDRDKAESMLRDAEEQARSAYVEPSLWVYIYMGLGETEKAYEWLDRAIEDQDIVSFWLKVDPVFDGLRDEPRFQEMLKRVGLAA